MITLLLKIDCKINTNCFHPTGESSEMFKKSLHFLTGVACNFSSDKLVTQFSELDENLFFLTCIKWGKYATTYGFVTFNLVVNEVYREAVLFSLLDGYGDGLPEPLFFNLQRTLMKCRFCAGRIVKRKRFVILVTIFLVLFCKNVLDTRSYNNCQSLTVMQF